MKKVVIVFGLISGTIAASLMAVGMAMASKHGGGSMLFGYASMVLAFSLIFVAIKSYRDKQNAGVISFGKAFTIGLLISLIASTMYVATWAIEYNYFMPDFMDKYTAGMLTAVEKTGNAAKIAATKEKIQGLKDAYANPVTFTMYTYFEILPVGILVSLIAAAILKKKQPALKEA